VLCFASARCLLSSQTAVETYTYSYNGRPLAIYPDDSNINHTRFARRARSMKIQSVKVTIDIDYPRPGRPQRLPLLGGGNTHETGGAQLWRQRESQADHL